MAQRFGNPCGCGAGIFRAAPRTLGASKAVGWSVILGSPEVEDTLILSAAQLSGVNEFVGKHAKGFDLEIGEQGRSLSGGQRQNVAIARALLHDPPILVFDEPTGSMDNRTETRLKNSLTQLLPGKTLILITHRRSLLDLADRIVLIDNAMVVADGPRDQVITAMKSRGTIQPGIDLIETFPLEDSLLIEARIKPADIAFLHPNQQAMVKFTA